MSKYRREQKGQRKQSKKNAHKRIPPNFHRFIWNGTQFASKLEISWAHFLNGLGIRWEYESRTVFLYKGTPDITGYIPDFWLPELEVFLEIKGRVISTHAVARMEETSHEVGVPIIMAQGSPSRALGRHNTDGGMMVTFPNSAGQWRVAYLYQCSECRVPQFYILGEDDETRQPIGETKICSHNNYKISDSILQSIAGKRIPDSSIHLLSKRTEQL